LQGAMYFYRINKLIKEVKISARNYKKQGESYYQRPFWAICK
jgi:hypothetical protein